MNDELNKFKQEITEIISKSDNPNEQIKDILTDKSQKLKEVLEQIESLNNLKSMLSYEISALEEIRGDMHLILDISKELTQYEDKIKSSNTMNIWSDCYSNKKEGYESKMIGNYNKIYSASIVALYNEKENVYRIDFKLSINDIFIKYAKTYNGLSGHINEIKLISSGKIFFKKEDAENYIDECKEIMEIYFNENSSSFYKTFVDSNGETYSADTFLKYRASYVNGITILDEHFEYKNDDIENMPF